MGDIKKKILSTWCKIPQRKLWIYSINLNKINKKLSINPMLKNNKMAMNTNLSLNLKFHHNMIFFNHLTSSKPINSNNNKCNNC